ncbi:paladin isoform X2 [Eurytemora carolleeae]|uniref:paladin isoform X2 n=1 Tax=Eurytemora carolleeae TaxID=1294199 RepID=UPI000C781A51|nr:paladin isoform X2 [Eurytemora carolleeae]|eukprot:XP_023325849.1 paladin-like isoform X2 [Eurytemora affinis]
MAPPAAELKAMTDAFEGIDRLAEGAPRTEGAPNFRRLPGFPLFGTGQTTIQGFETCLEPVLKKYGDEKHIFWVNLRQEPVVYVNNKPFTARDPKNPSASIGLNCNPINFHLEINNPEECAAIEQEFAEEIKKRGDEFKFFKDQFGEHPEERATNVESTEKLECVTTVNEIYAAIKEKVPKLEPLRIPMNQEQAPAEANFDQIVAMLKDTTASCPVIFNCQAGISRTTTAIVIAALVKELQLARELERMRGIVPDDILDALKKKKLGLPGIDIDVQEDRNAMQMGEFEVIKELLSAFPNAKVAKAQVDKLIDLAAPPPRGTGVENIRECIIESKMSFDVSSDDWQAYLKNKIMNNIERYFYLIVFAMYVREVGPKGFPQTFTQFMDANSNLRTMIAEGRGKLEWERKIPDEKLEELKALLAAAEFKENMKLIIKRIYELSWDMFGDLPRGHHKNNSMHKLASKTMIEILPPNLAAHIEKKCGSLAGTPDFFDVIGQVSWYEPEA